MTLQKFEEQLKKFNPRLRVRQRGCGDVVSVYGGTGYICRLTKGELQMNGYRIDDFNPNTGEVMGKHIVKRGRKTTLNLLRSWRWITSLERTQILWGNLK